MDSVTVLLPSGQNIMVHKGWRSRNKPQFEPATHLDTKSRSPRCSRTSSDLCSKSQNQPPRKYRFITSTPANQNGPETLRIIRRHVRNEVFRDAKEKMKRNETNSRARSQKSQKSNLQSPIHTFDEHLLARSTSLSIYPINIEPHTHALLGKYLTYASRRMFPVGSSLKISPLKSPEWFHFAVTDAAMFHAMLYAAAMYLALLEGRQESKDTLHHQSQTISILRKRLGTLDQGSDDATLGAISCLAVGGVSLVLHKQGFITKISRQYQVMCIHGTYI